MLPHLLARRKLISSSVHRLHSAQRGNGRLSCELYVVRSRHVTSDRVPMLHAVKPGLVNHSTVYNESLSYCRFAPRAWMHWCFNALRCWIIPRKDRSGQVRYSVTSHMPSDMRLMLILLMCSVGFWCLMAFCEAHVQSVAKYMPLVSQIAFLCIAPWSVLFIYLFLFASIKLIWFGIGSYQCINGASKRRFSKLMLMERISSRVHFACTPFAL